MRQSPSRSVIYAVIGIGLLALIVSQFSGTDSQSAHVVPHPFDSLDEYQPNLDPDFAANSMPAVAPQPNEYYSLASQAVSPQSIEQPMSQPTEIGSIRNETSNPAEVANSVNEFVNSPNGYSLDSPDDVDPSDSIEFNEMEVADALGNMELPEGTNESPSEMTPFRFNADPVAVSEIQSETQADLQSEPKLDVDAAGIRVAALEAPMETLAATVPSTNAPAETSIDIRSARKGWKTNPFINDDAPAASPQPPANESVQNDVQATSMLSSDMPAIQLDEHIQLPDFGTPDVIATASTIQDTVPVATPIMTSNAQPAIDHETMRSVIAPENNFGMDSPPIRIGLSETDAQKAVHNIEYGKSLSRRGAAFAARQEFYSSLRILAQSHDKASNGKIYTEALGRGITAIKEAEDFMVTDTESQIGLNVAHVVETHSTKIFSAEAAQEMTSIEAVQRYLAYASHELSLCGGENVVSSEALYCLGKLHSVQANHGTNSSKIDVAKAMAFHQAAVAADSTNFRSLNELGVLYANTGRFSESKDLLKRSLRIKQLPQAWQNLGVIHQRLGEQQLAELAIKEYQLVSSQKPDSTIRWTPAEEFNKNAPMLNRTADKSNEQPKPSKVKSLGDRILDSIR